MPDQRSERMFAILMGRCGRPIVTVGGVWSAVSISATSIWIERLRWWPLGALAGVSAVLWRLG